MIKILIRTDASNTIGMGHIARCVSLSRHLEAEGVEPFFVMRHAPGKVVEDYLKLGENFFLLDENYSLDDEATYLIEHFASQYSVILFDFSHPQNIEKIQEFIPYFKILQNSFQATFLIDGFCDTAIIDYIDPAVDVVITPYLGADNYSPNGSKGYQHWTGPSYFIFAPEYTSESWGREVRSTAERLLVTMGGSDPYELTLFILDALKLVSKKFYCRVVVGSGFSDGLKDKIWEQCQSFPFCEIIDKPLNLAGQFKWAEMAISASGLTKYEMALTGVPSLQLSLNKELAEITAEYEKEGFYRDLGLYSESDPRTIAIEVDDLAGDFDTRKSMIERGQAVFDQSSGLQQFICVVKSGIISAGNRGF